MRPLRRIFIALYLSLVAASYSRGQITNVTNEQATPTPGVGHDYIRMLSETVNPSNGSLSIRIQTPTPKGRQLTLPFAFAYDSNGTNNLQPGGAGEPEWSQDYRYLYKGGWSYSVPLLSYTYQVRTTSGGGHTTTCAFDSNYMFQDPSGGNHALGLAYAQSQCQTIPIPYSVLAGGDDSYRASMTSGVWPASVSVAVASAEGTVYNFSGLNTNDVGRLPSSIEDRNGNKITATDNQQGAFSFTDTLGRTLISSSSFGSTTGDAIHISGLAIPYTVTWKTVSTNFTVGYKLLPGTFGSVPSDVQQRSVISSIALPNGQSYTFLYGTDDPNNSNPYGLLSKIVYPSGGWVKYKYGANLLSEYFSSKLTNVSGGDVFCELYYDTPAITQRTVSFNGVDIALQQSFTYSTNWNGSAWTTKQTIVNTHDLVSGQATETDYVYGYVGIPLQPNEPYGSGPQVPVEQTVTYKDGSGNVLRTVAKSWQDQYLLAQQQVTLGSSGPSSKVTYTYGPGGQVTEKDEYDFGQTTPARITKNSYQSFPNTPIYTNGVSIFDKPCQTIIYDGSGTNRMAETDYFYDGSTSTTPCSTATTQALPGSGSYTNHDETLYGTGATVARGNLTKVINQCFQGTQACSGGNPVTTVSYDETGQAISKTDPKGNVTTYSYTDNFDSPPSTNTNAFLTQISHPVTNGVNHIDKFKYAYSDSQLVASWDQGNQETQYTYNDSLRRLTGITLADGGQTTKCYTDVGGTTCTKGSAPFQIVTTEKLSASTNLTSTVVLDGLGRLSQTQLNSAQPVIFTDTTYDGLGHVATLSNPHFATASPTDGITTYTYDALGRLTQVTHPDSTTVLTTYTGRATQVQDEGNGSQRITRISQSDALGRLLSVCEVSSTTLLGSGGAPAACGQDIAATGFLTTYQYDAVNNLLQVNQGTLAPRTFAYDSLSRLITASNPESGTISYTYDANGNLQTKTAPAPNQTGSATVTTTYAYDALNRLTKKSYSDTTPVYANGTPSVLYGYDATSFTACTSTSFPIANTIGRLSWTAPVDQNTIPITMHSFGYDAVGRTTQFWQCVPANRNVKDTLIGNNYDLAGNLVGTYISANQTAPQGTTTLTNDGAGRLIKYVSNNSPDFTDITGITYDPLGHKTSATFANGVTQTWAYNSRGFLTNMAAGSGCSGGSCTTTKYGYTLSYAPDGNVTSANDTVNGNWTYSYDAFNRLSCSSLAANGTCPASSSPTLSFGYDRFGNRWNQSGTNNMALTFSANNNRIDGYCYDSAGNLLDQGPCPTGSVPHMFKYDAENRLISVNQGAATYIYDGQGRRVQKNTGSTTESYIFDKDNNPISNWISGNPSYIDSYVGNWHFETCYVNAAHNACTTYFHSQDWLGTERMRSDMSGNVAETCTSLPFGDGQHCSGTTDFSPMHFTGKERDSESGLDNFGARYDSSQLGRFMSPDWSASPESVPYADYGDPESLNLYSYVRNNPIQNSDVDGHHQECEPNVDYVRADGAYVLVVGKCTEVPDPRPWIFTLGAVGHHGVARAVIKTLNLTKRARIFLNRRFITGALKGRHLYNAAHRAYNQAVRSLVRNYELERAAAGRQGQILEDEARQIADNVLNSRDPQIEEFIDNLPETASGRSAREALEDALVEGDAAELPEALEVLGVAAEEAVPAIAEEFGPLL